MNNVTWGAQGSDSHHAHAWFLNQCIAKPENLIRIKPFLERKGSKNPFVEQPGLIFTLWNPGFSWAAITSLGSLVTLLEFKQHRSTGSKHPPAPWLKDGHPGLSTEPQHHILMLGSFLPLLGAQLIISLRCPVWSIINVRRWLGKKALGGSGWSTRNMAAPLYSTVSWGRLGCSSLKDEEGWGGMRMFLFHPLPPTLVAFSLFQPCPGANFCQKGKKGWKNH